MTALPIARWRVTNDVTNHATNHVTNDVINDVTKGERFSSVHSKCELCAAGRQQPFAGQHQCYQCTPGRFAADGGSRRCTACPIGKFQPARAMAACQLCATDADTSATGMSRCDAVPCGPGLRRTSEHGGACLACPRGRFLPWSGGVRQTCFYCPTDKFNEVATGVAHCKQCARGKSTDGKYGSKTETKCVAL
jgi:hypothetical protein